MSIESDLLGLGDTPPPASAPSSAPSQSSSQSTSLLDLLDATPSSLSSPPPPQASSSPAPQLSGHASSSEALPSQPAPAPSGAADVPEKVAVQFFAVGGAQQLNDKNGKKLACKFPSTNKFAAVVAKIKTHLPGDDNLFCFISCGDAQFAPSPDALLGDLFRTAKRPAIMVVSYCNKINYG